KVQAKVLYINTTDFLGNGKPFLKASQTFYNSSHERQRNLYSIEEKCQAMELARRTSNTYAANHYSLDLMMLGQWVKLFSQGTTSKKNSRRVGSGRHAFFPEEEAQLYE
ncbi:14665_t:CDS:1, partial [Cetraspora pellucida]